MSPNDADGMANSVHPDQSAPPGAVWSGFALFVQAYLSENLGFLRYTVCPDLSVQKLTIITVNKYSTKTVDISKMYHF